jgi:hypothetical protein
MKFRPRTKKVRVYQGDHEAALAELRAKIDDARRANSSPTRLLSDGSSEAELVEEYNALLEEAKADAVELTMTALSRPRWKALVEEHPAVEGKSPEGSIVDEDSFAPALIVESVLTKPPGDETERPSREELLEWVDMLSSGQLDDLYGVAFALNRTGASDPKSLSVSAPTTSSGETRN